MPTVTPPFVQFKDEPPTLAEQFAEIGGVTMRHGFGERCYNPGLTHNRFKTSFAWMKGEYLMTFRSQEFSKEGIAVSHLALCGVERNGSVQWSAKLDLPNIRGITGIPMQEDGRLFWFNSKLWLAFSDVHLRPLDVSFKQSLVELIPVLPEDMNDMRYKPRFEPGPLKRLAFGNNSALVGKHEKNWQFFETNGDMAFVYSISPHVVVKPATNETFVSHTSATADWEKGWGEMHGGTPPILLRDGSYLSFFNSFIGHVEHQRRYVIGAYIFASHKRGFKITHVLNKPLVVGSEREGFLWESPAFWEPVVAFATGAIYDGLSDCIRLSYGVNDCYGQTSVFPLAQLMSRMVAVD